MQMILNELSAKFPAGSADDAREVMRIFLETCHEVKRIIHNDSILLDQDYRSFELAAGYRIEQWRNDPAVDVENKRRFRMLLNKSAVYNSAEFEEEKGWDFRTEFQHEERVSKGCLLVYEMDGVAVSFLSDVHWKTAEIEGTYIELTEDGDLHESQVKIPNVSFEENVEKFKEFYERKKEEWRYTDIVSGEDILKYAQKAFPNLVFCENAVQGCRKNVGISEAGQVYKRLLELQRAAERIFFYPAPEEKVIYVGHVGHKLPTVNYH